MPYLLFDSSLNRLTKSVYAPQGSVKAHFGEFVNLSVEYFTAKNIDSLKPQIKEYVDDIARESGTDHNVMQNRFSSSTAEEEYKNIFAHDAAYIVYKDGISVEDKLNESEESTTKITEDISVLNESVSTMSEDIVTISDNIETLNSSIAETDNNVNSIKETLGLAEGSDDITTKGNINSGADVTFTVNGSIYSLSNLLNEFNQLKQTVKDLSTRLDEANALLSNISGEEA